MKTIQIHAGKPTKIISKFSNSLTITYHFTASNAVGNNPPSGIVEVKGSNWIFPKPSKIQPLQKENYVTKTMWDVFFNVYVTSDHEVTITLNKGRMKGLLILAVLILCIGLAASILMIAGVR